MFGKFQTRLKKGLVQILARSVVKDARQRSNMSWAMSYLQFDIKLSLLLGIYNSGPEPGLVIGC